MGRFVRRNRFQRIEPSRSDEGFKLKKGVMKSGDMSKTTAIAVAVLSLAMYAMAQKGVGPPAGRGTGPTSGMPSQSMTGQQQNQSMQSQENPSAPSTSPAGISKAQSKVKTSPTPRGHHYGWQKGRHNPHH